MLRKGIYTAPRRDDDRVEELLRSSGAFQPDLADEEEYGEHDAIADECATHDEMRQTLAQMVTATEAEGRNPAKEHLYPARNRHDLANYTVACDDMPPYARVYALRQVKFEIYT